MKSGFQTLGFNRLIPFIKTSILLGFLLFLSGCEKPQTPSQEAAASPSESTEAAISESSDENLGAWQVRKGEQMEKAKSYSSFYGFQFSDEYQKTGITFRHRIVEDSGKNWKPVHYDHGTGLTAADIDNDGLLDLYFVNHIGENQLWRGLGKGEFENITEEAGVGLKQKISAGAAFGDIDNDGDVDLFVTTVKMGNHLFENDGKGRFKDISTAAGVDQIAHSSGPVFFDYDNDGLLDLFVANVGVYTLNEKGRGGFYLGMLDGFEGHTHPERYERSFLYHNEGGNSFKETAEAVGLIDDSWSGDASICDLNSDGFMDLYVLNMQGDDHYYENQGGKSFVEKAGDYFPKTSWGAMGVKFFDYNLDGHMDLYITDMHSDMTDAQTTDGKDNITLEFEKGKSERWCGIEWTDAFLQGAANNIFGNVFYKNNGDGSFVEVSDQNGTETYWPWGVSVGDLNADGYEDIFVTGGMGYVFRYGINSVLLNEQGERFFDAEYLVGVEPRLNGRTHKTAFRLYCDSVDKDHPACAGLTGTVTVDEALSTRSSIIIDLDDDGDLDIVTNEMNDRPQIFFSNLSEKKEIHFLKIKLIGQTSNRDAIGASVRVSVGGQLRIQMQDGKASYLGHSVIPLYFGLGNSTSVDFIEVKWPHGEVQKIENPSIDQLIVITEEN